VTAILEGGKGGGREWEERGKGGLFVTSLRVCIYTITVWK
jgi:hypothetical protein